MYYYKLYDMKIATDMEFFQLVVCEDDKEPDIEICEGEIPEDIIAQKARKYAFSMERCWLSNKTCYMVAENGNKLTYQKKPEGKVMYLQTYLLGFGMSMLAMQKGILSIHCSALADDKGALLIAGESGAGKSTLTTAFLDKGYRLMADDMAWVEVTDDQKVLAKPAFPFQKLCRNVAMEQGYNLDELLYINEEKDKFMAPYRGTFKTEPVPVKGFIMLGVAQSNEVECKEVQSIQKFQLCANNLFLRHLLKQDKYQPYIGQRCMKLAAAIPMYYIIRPDGKDTAAEVIEKAFEIVKAFVQ